MPDWSKEVKTLLSGLKIEPTREADITEEISQHLNDRYEELLGKGITEQNAQNALREELTTGRLNAQLRSLLPSVPDPCVPGKDERGNSLAGLWKDLRYAMRTLRLNLGFSIVAILSLMLGIGANTAIFQLLDAIRLRSLPVEAPQELALVHLPQEQGRTGSFRGRIFQLTTDIWEYLRDHQQAFSNIGAWGSTSVNLSQGGEARLAEVLWVSGSFFQTLGLPPAQGRLITPADDQRGCGSPGIVISDSFWHREFGGGPVLGQKLTLQGHPFEVMGITPAGFFGMEVGRNFDVALPICAESMVDSEEPPVLTKHYGWWLGAIGRLNSGWTPEKATSQLAAISPALFQATLPPEYTAHDRKNYLGFKLEATPAAGGVSSLRHTYQSPLCLLLAISALVLLIACANLANLLLARASARQREMAVRLALGASRVRLLRQLLAESALLAIIGTLLGLGLAQGLSRLLISFLSSQDSHWFLDLHPDWRVLSFSAGLAILTCILFGLMPAIRASRTSPGEAMKATGRSLTTTRERFGLRRALVVSQVALSLVLVVGALLFVRTLRNLVTLDAGFQEDHILFTDVDLTPVNMPVERRAAFRQELLDRVRAIPGVTSAADVVIVPVSGNGWNDTVEIPNGKPMKQPWANFNMVSSGYFKAMGTSFLAGRDFNDSDTLASPLVAIVTEKFAQKFFAGDNPVGKTFSVVEYANKPKKEYQIIGLVRDVKYMDLREDFTPIVFLDDAQSTEQRAEAQLVLSSNESLQEVTSSVKRVVMEMNSALVIQFSPFHTIIRQSLLRERLMATLSGFFGLLAAILAMIGLYGVISYMVVRRKNEIGIRMALGADRGNILRIIMSEAALLLGIGVCIGTVLTIIGVKAADTLLFGLSPRDPGTIVAAIGGVAVIAMLASFWPAHRAAGIDPMMALRDE